MGNCRKISPACCMASHRRFPIRRRRAGSPISPSHFSKVCVSSPYTSQTSTVWKWRTSRVWRLFCCLLQWLFVIFSLALPRRHSILPLVVQLWPTPSRSLLLPRQVGRAPRFKLPVRYPMDNHRTKNSLPPYHIHQARKLEDGKMSSRKRKYVEPRSSWLQRNEHRKSRGRSVK